MDLIQKILGSRKAMGFAAAIVAALCASVVFAGVAAERSGLYWMGFNGGEQPARVEDSKGFIMVDVSGAQYGGAFLSDADEEDTEVVSLGMGPTPSIPTLTTEELKLYSVLTRGDGFLTSKDKDELYQDVHWREVVLEKGDTIESIAAAYGLSAADIRAANEIKAAEMPDYAEVIYIPDSKEYVIHTLEYVRKLKKVEEDFKRQGKPVDTQTHIVQQGDSLWSIASRYNLELDTIIGSNRLSDVNKLTLGMTLRIPNQDGIFINVSKNDSVEKLAKKYGIYKEAVYTANMMREDAQLQVGKEVFLPGAKLVAAAEPANAANKTAGRAAAKIIGVSGVKFRWPLVGHITSQYGWRRSPFGSRRVFHSGLDIGAPKGRAIVAAAAGNVVYSGWMGGYGYAVVIAHSDGSSTLYGHCSSLVAKKGDSVRSGQIIARVGSTGRSTGNHLHFEVRIKGATQNPLRYLR